MKITDSMIKKSCSSTIYKRGIEYFREGRVHLRRRSSGSISAIVDGSEIYNVQVNYNENGIESCMCTCPYFQTMDSVCKHIVAAMKQRQLENEESDARADGSVCLAGKLCGFYAARREMGETLFPCFTLHLNTRAQSNFAAVSMEFNGIKLRGIERFLECYISEREFKSDYRFSYIPGKTRFGENHGAIIDILAEGYENRAEDARKNAFNTPIGRRTLGRLMPYLRRVGFSLVLDSMFLGSVSVFDENPDVLIDINAFDGEITMTVSERGLALTSDGEWFFYDGAFYHTDGEWREYYMPIYNSLEAENRNYIAFRGADTLAFASEVLPAVHGKKGVIEQGLDELIVSERPEFEIYLDARGKALTAVIIARYGAIKLRIPDETVSGGKIVVRDFEAENSILDFFSDFSRENGTFILDDDNKIYDFITFSFPLLRSEARLYASDRFNYVLAPARADIKISADYAGARGELLEADFETDLSYEQLREILRSVRLRRKFCRLEDGRFLLTADAEKNEELSLLETLDFSDRDLRERKKTLPKYQALYLDSLSCVEKSESFTRLIESARSAKHVYPAHLENVLRGYQKEGTAWMKQLSLLGFGGILADDMGLGKTLQVIAFVMSERPDRPVLIVAPSALLYNWYNEIKRFTPEASALIADGIKSEREKLIKTADEYDFVITSYPLLRRDEAFYKDIRFSYCFIDEAQYIKNPKTLNARSVKNVNAGVKFALTGTPIENSLTELWSIFDFVMHGYLRSAADFKRRYETPVMREGDASVSKNLRDRIRPFVLRRMKADVLAELPEKIENTMYCDLVPEQKKLYAAYLASARDATLSILGGGGTEKMRILTLLMRLRQICCHPSLFDENYKRESGKLNLLMDIVEGSIESGHRILIFSQFTSMLDIIEKSLASAKIGSFRIDGSTKARERSDLSERFNAGEGNIFLISLKAGGTGLNLIGADMVIHYDPWWNPAVTDQASDRAYRIGQTRAVQVIRLVSRGTIEEKILRLQESKRFLADDIIRVSSESFASLSNEEILSLFD